MPRKSNNEIIQSQFFRWKLARRNSVYIADGRTNRPSLGRHSLGTRDRERAFDALKKLDQIMAQRRGLIKSASSASEASIVQLTLEEGWQRYDEYLTRPAVAGGASAKSRQRYRAIYDKFVAFAAKRKVAIWADVTNDLLLAYIRDLERRGYAERTLYIEGTTLTQIVKWLVEQKLLPQENVLKLPLRKVRGSNTYCYTTEQVTAMIDHCRCQPNLVWLASVIIGLARTGLRISELVALRWSDVDLDRNVIVLTNDALDKRVIRTRRQTKNRRDRTLPIHSELVAVLLDLQQRPHKEGLVFHGPRGGKLKADTVRNVLIKEVIEPLKNRFPTPPDTIGFEHGRLHSFRHYFCSVAAAAGVPEATTMSWLGHLDSEIARRYFHLHDGVAQLQMQKIQIADDSHSSGAAAQSSEKQEEPVDCRMTQ